MADFSGQPDPFGMMPPAPEVWPPPEWGTDPLAFGQMPPVEETAQPVPAAAPALTDAQARDVQTFAPGAMQPGLGGIPTDVVDRALQTAPQTDAVSGAAPIVPRAEEPPAPTPEPQNIWEETPKGPSLDRSFYEAMYKRDPIALHDAQQQWMGERDAIAREGMEKAREEDDADRAVIQQRREQAAMEHRNSMKQLDQEWRALANTKMDPHRWWKNKSTGSKIAGVIAAVMGGLVSGRTGGPNTGLAMLQREMEADIEAQKSDLYTAQQGLHARKGLLGELNQITGDELRSAELIRQATYERALQQVQTDAQNFHPEGRQFFEHMEFAQNIRAAQQKSAMDFAQKDLKYRTDQAELEGKQLANQAARKKLAGIGQGAGPKLTPEQWKAQGLKPPPYAMDGKEYDQWKGRVKVDAELGKEERGLEREQVVGGVVEVGKDGATKIRPLQQVDGSTYTPPKEDAPKIRESREGVQDLVDSLNGLKKLRTAEGGANKFTSPGTQAEYTRLTNKAVIAYAKAKGLSVSDESSINFARDALFGGDPSDYHVGDVVGRIENSIGEAKASYLGKLRGANYNGNADEALQFVPAPYELNKSTVEDVIRNREAEDRRTNAATKRFNPRTGMVEIDTPEYDPKTGMPLFK